MRKLVLLFLLIPGILFAGGPQESEGITFAAESDWVCATAGNYLGWDPDSLWYSDHVIKEFTEETGIPVEIISVSSEDNTTKKLDAMIAAGLAPNVYVDYAGRSGLYANSKMALPLNKYLTRDVLEQYYPSYLDMFREGNNYYGLPLTSWATMGVINLSLLEKAGMMDALEDGLTYDEVYLAGKKLHAIDPTYLATFVFANQSGGDYWLYTFWLGGFGAKLYNDDGTIGLNTPEGRAALSTMKKWYDEGLINKGAPGEGPGEYLGSFGNGFVLTISSRYNDAKAPNEAGSFKASVIGTPRVPGVEFAPVATGPDFGVAFNVGTEGDKRAAAKLLAWVTSAKYQEVRAKDGRFPSIFGVQGSDDPYFKQNVEYMEKHGVMYHGIGSKHYQEIRALWFPMIQAILTGELSVDEALARFEQEGNEIIAR